MQNYVAEKNSLPFTAPAGGVVSGNGYLIGSLFVVAKVSALAGATFAGVLSGAVSLPKTAGQAVAEGATLYWDNTNMVVTTTIGSNTKIGAAGQGGAQAADASVVVILNGTV